MFTLNVVNIKCLNLIIFDLIYWKVKVDGRLINNVIIKQSTYKSLFISPRTTCYEAIIMLLAMCQQPGPPTDFRLYLSDTGNDLNMNDTLVDLYSVLPKNQKIVIRSVS